MMNCRNALTTFLFVCATLNGVATAMASLNAPASYQYKRADEGASTAAAEGELTALALDGVNYIPTKQFCGVFACRALYQWGKHRLLVENPGKKSVAIVSHLSDVAVVDGKVVPFKGRIVITTQQGYLLPSDLAVKLASHLGLGKVTETASDESEQPIGMMQSEPLKTLIIDAGHGGADHGTQMGSLTEKDIALIYALKLRDEIRREIPHLQVKLTRDSDKFVSLAERTRFANEKGGGLYLSLHVNHASDSNISGAETFILSPEATDSDARKTALLENEGWMKNAQTELPTSDGIKKIFVDLEQQRFIQSSALFAAYVQQELGRIESGKAVKNRGVKQAFFYVLSQAAMPAVLVEMGFLSNAKDRDRLMNVSFRDNFVGALVMAIRRYQLKMLP